MTRRSLLLAGAALAGCSRRKARMDVGSKAFTEQDLLAEMALRRIRSVMGVDGEAIPAAGPTACHPTLMSGQTVSYVENGGTALYGILKLPPGAPSEIVNRVRREYAERYQMEWLAPLGYQTTFAVAARAVDAAKLAKPALSEATKRSQGWALAAAHDFLQRPDGLPALSRTYQMDFQVMSSGLDPKRMHFALQEKKVDLVVTLATDGMLLHPDIRRLEDDLSAFAAYETAFVARTAVLNASPGLRDALASLSGKLTEESMRELNRQVDVDGLPLADVVRVFLQGKGLT